MRKIASRRVFQVSFVVIFAISLVSFTRCECACRKLARLTWCEWDGRG